jgi:uncharacterized damage-inducible protein DinB
MRPIKSEHPSGLREVLIETWAANDAINQLVLAHLDPRAWRDPLPGKRTGGRTIGAISAHLHNCRVNWIRRNAYWLRVPAMLDPYRCTIRQTQNALKQSAAQCTKMLADALGDGTKRRMTQFTRDSWMPAWPAGATMFAYMFAHEAHHRGQILMLAHQLGYRVPAKINGAIWNWDKLWKDSGFKTRPR